MAVGTAFMPSVIIIMGLGTDGINAFPTTNVNWIYCKSQVYPHSRANTTRFIIYGATADMYSTIFTDNS